MVSQKDAASQLASRVTELRQQIGRIDPHLLASRTGSCYEAAGSAGPHFAFSMWNRPVVLTFPELVVYSGPDMIPADGAVQALVNYYFLTADGTPVADRWIAFSDLPDGTFYNQAFQGYTGGELARQFRDDVDAFAAAALNGGGLRLRFADYAFAFQPLPRVPLMAACWLGDEEFPTAYRILFDSSVGHYLPTDACAILGSMLARRIVRAKSQKEQPL